VDWKYYGRTHDLHFHAGFIGATQDRTTGELTPTLGWNVTHDPPKDPAEHKKEIEKEIEGLKAGHSNDANAGPWHDRVKTLEVQLARINAVAQATEQKEQLNDLKNQKWSIPAEEKAEWESQMVQLEAEFNTTTTTFELA